MNKKRGLSPVIATILLISIAVILALIIFLWAKSVVAEKVQKFGEPIENSCTNIVFQADAASDGTTLSVDVLNQGNVALYAVQILKGGIGGSTPISDTPFQRTIGSGESTTISVDLATVNSQVVSGDQITVVPVIIGETSQYKKEYPCSQQGQTVTVA